MKIYNKRIFVEGIFFTILGGILLGTIFTTNFDIKKMVLSILLLLVGVGFLQRSLSRAMAREDKTDGLDERNRFISLKSKGKSLQITQIISCVLMIVLFVVGGMKKNTLLLSFGIGVMLPFMISLFSELFCVMYYEIKN